MIEDGTNGFVVPIGDEKSFAEALMKLVENKALPKRTIRRKRSGHY